MLLTPNFKLSNLLFLTAQIEDGSSILTCLIQFKPYISYMQENKENQLFIFEDDQQNAEASAPRQPTSPSHQEVIEPIELDSQSLGNQLEPHEPIISPNFNSLPPHLKKQQNTQDQLNLFSQGVPKSSNLVFLQQNAYSFRKDEFQHAEKQKPSQIKVELDVISDFNSELSKNESLIPGQEQDTSGLSRKNERSRRNKNKSRFQDINDSSSVTSSKLADKVDHFKESQKIIPNILSKAAEKEDEAQYHKTEDHLRHDKKDHEQIVQSITGIRASKKQDRALPPINSHKQGQIFINTSGILQNQTSMVALKKQEVNKLSMTNMSSLSQLLHMNEQQKIKKIAERMVPMAKTFKCSFQREKKCGLSYWHPDFSIYYKSEKLILNAKKQCGRINSRYNISSEYKKFDSQSDGFLGYLAGNFVGTCFNLYQIIEDAQQLVCTIAYETELSCSSSFRKIEVYVKNLEYSSESLFRGPNPNESNLKQLYNLGQNAKQNKIFKLINKKPEWSEQLNGYSLNFKGKCKMGSVKNSVFIAQNQPNRYILLFCKTDTHSFHTQISYPLSPFIAMGIILSSFDFKLFCQ